MPRALVVVLLFTSVPVVMPATATSRGCWRRAAHTAVANANTRVIRDRLDRVYACRLPSGRPALLGRGDDYPDSSAVRHIRLAGFCIGYEIASAGREGTSSSVNTYNARTARRRALPSTARPEPPDQPRYGAAEDLEVNAACAVAWITTNQQGTLEVAEADTQGTAILATGAIAPTSLAISGPWAFWIQDGQPHLGVLS
jgi:hypothetical protein